MKRGKVEFSCNLYCGACKVHRQHDTNNYNLEYSTQRLERELLGNILYPLYNIIQCKYGMLSYLSSLSLFLERPINR